jgi:1,5-anhydro-D-fructose reductase (1,5-anhydro-D-mannitol-forming)
MKKVRYGIIGFGKFAERAIAPAIQNSSNSELVAIQKRSMPLAREKAAQLGVPLAFDSVDGLVAHPDVDAVFIVSANSVHAEETIKAACAGKHVLVEKPIAATTVDAGRMIDECELRHVKFMVGHMVRLSPLVRRVRDIVRSGELGNVIYARADFAYDGRMSARTWLFDPKVAGGGPLYDVGVHCLDTLRYVLDDEVESFTSEVQPRPTQSRTENTGVILLRFTRGAIGSIFCSYVMPVRSRMLEVVCSEGIISAPEFTVPNETLTLTVTRGKNDKPASVITERIAVPNLYIEEVTHFSDCILNDKQPMLTGKSALENLRVVERASWSSTSEA